MIQFSKSVIGICFLLIMSIKTLMIPMIYIDFEIRRDYISRNLCENRNKPSLNCDGKCYLAKKIAAANEQEERQAECDFMSKLIEVASSIPLQTTFPNPLITVIVSTLSIETPYTSPFVSQITREGVFHPPIFSA
jgi:hypothetical protein